MEQRARFGRTIDGDPDRVAPDLSGKPGHCQLRKEFGSVLASNFGLFATQNLLGHTDPKVTAKYYAGLVDLPELSHVRITAR